MKNTLVKSVRSIGLACLILPSVWAANYQGVVSNVTPYQGKIFVTVGAGAFGGTASQCPFSTSMVYSFDPTTPFGRSMLSVLIAAKVTGKLVYMYGDSNCTIGTPYSGTAGFEGLVGVDLKG